MLYGGNYFIQRDVVETKNARIWKREDGIIEIKFNEGVVETLDSAKEIFKVAKRLNEGKNGLVLVDATDIVYIVGEARHYLATDNEIKRLTKRLAIFANSFVGRHLSNLFIVVNKPLFPFKFFNSKEEAIKWLKKK